MYWRNGGGYGIVGDMPIKTRTDLSAESIREILEYDPDTGILRWKANSRYAGKRAGRVGPSGAIQIGIDGALYLAHRLVWLIVTGQWPTALIDHVNHDRSDNRFANLREATVAENRHNLAGPAKGNRSGFLGVCFRPHVGKWMAYIFLDGRMAWTYYTDTAEKAAAARRAVLPQFHGEFASQRDH